ncbi:MAG: metallophosphoesterase [Alphaproteobacteria bacterium]|nr:metallophosphoesterase [Alphaproteobacteria bacterium]MCL2504874.1 metallophosphoesterase [Alphaproteobacteria bacterium]
MKEILLKEKFLILSTLFMSVLFAYAVTRGIWKLEIAPVLKWSVSLFLLTGVFNVVFLLSVRPDAYNFLSILFGTAQVSIVFLFLATLVLEGLRIANVYTNMAGVIIMSCAAVLAVYSVYNSGTAPRVRNIEIASPLLPEDWKPIRIVQLSDMHIGMGMSREDFVSAIAEVKAIKPDMIVITGDVIDGYVEELLSEVSFLKELEAPLGVFAVNGNHETFFGIQKWTDAFEAMGISVLRDEYKTVKNDKHDFVIKGIEGSSNSFSEKQETNLPVIILAHYPGIFLESKKQNPVLQLSGHTHGGMFFPVSMLVKAFNKGYVRGLYQENNSFLYVTDGTDLWRGFPSRLGTSNEIPVITLKSKM